MKNLVDRFRSFLKSEKETGMILISILLMAIILLMVGSSIIVINNHTRGFTTSLEKKTQALKAAEAGVYYAIYNIKQDSNWGNSTVKDFGVAMKNIDAGFEITFDSTKGYHSTNHLNGEFPLPSGNPTTYKNQGIPHHSLDLIVTGRAGSGFETAIKRIRVIIQRDVNFGSALASGSVNVSANLMDLSKEATVQNPSEGGTLHSNSIRTFAGIPGGMAIDTVIGGNTTQVILHGGTASAQGEIEIPDLDTASGSKVDPVKQSREITPIDIKKTIDGATASLTPVAGGTYLVGKNGLKKSGIDVTVDGITVLDGKVYITKDIMFNSGVRFEFNYGELKELGRSGLKNSGIYLQDPNNPTVQPALYVSGDLAVAGPVRGNGAIYSSGEASFLGESNIVAPTDPGVVILSENSMNMALPETLKLPLEIDFKGLVYTHGNANISILDPNNPINPAKLADPNASWPTDWEDIVLSPLSFKTSEINGMTLDPNDVNAPVYANDYIVSADGTKKWEISADADFGEVVQYDDMNYSLMVDPNTSSASQIKITYSELTSTYIPGSSGSGWSGGTASTTVVSWDKKEEVTLRDFTDETKFPIPIGTGGYYPLQGTYPTDGQLSGTTMESLGQALNYFFMTYVPPDPTGDKVAPNFHITGALVAIDPNNPVPINTGTESPDRGNIHVNIFDPNTPDPTQGGNLYVMHSSRYLKLLQASKAYTGYRWVYWSEI